MTDAAGRRSSDWAERRLFFTELLDECVGDPVFVPRTELEAAVRGHLAEGRRFVIVTGPPGSGKTTLLAALAAAAPAALRYFVRREGMVLVAGGGAVDCLLTLGAQFRATHPECRPAPVPIEGRIDVSRVEEGATVVGQRIGELVVSPFVDQQLIGSVVADVVGGAVVALEIERVVTDPRLSEPALLQFGALLDPAQTLARRFPDRRVLVVIDGLDEDRFGVPPDVVSWLLKMPDPPPNLRFVLACRDGDPAVEPLRASAGGTRTAEVALHRNPAEAHRTIRDVLGRSPLDGSLQDAAAILGIPTEDLTERIVERSEESLLYAVTAARALGEAAGTEGGADEREAEIRACLDLPRGLIPLYTLLVVRLRRDWESRHPARPWTSGCAGLLRMLAVAREPLSRRELLRLAGRSPDDDAAAGEELAHMSELLALSDGRLRLRHPSLASFLASASMRSAVPDVSFDRSLTGLEIARRAQETDPCRWGAGSHRYAIRHVISHLVEAAQDEDVRAEAGRRLTALLLDPAYLGVRAHDAGCFALEADLARARAAIGDDRFDALRSRVSVLRGRLALCDAAHAVEATLRLFASDLLASPGSQDGAEASVMASLIADRDTGRLREEVPAAGAVGVTFAPDGTLLAAAADGTVVIRRPGRGLRAQRAGADGIECMAASGADGPVVMGTRQGAVILLGIDGVAGRANHRVGDCRITSIVLGRNGELCACALEDGALCILDLTDGRQTRRDAGAEPLTDPTVSMSADGGLIAHTDGAHVLLLGPDAGEIRCIDCPDAADVVIGAALTADGGRLLIAGAFGSISMVDVASAGAKWRIDAGADLVACALSDDGTRVAAITSDAALMVWDGVKGAELALIPAVDDEPPLAVVLSADGRRAATGHRHAVRVWDARRSGARPAMPVAMRSGAALCAGEVALLGADGGLRDLTLDGEVRRTTSWNSVPAAMRVVAARGGRRRLVLGMGRVGLEDDHGCSAHPSAAVCGAFVGSAVLLGGASGHLSVLDPDTEVERVIARLPGGVRGVTSSRAGSAAVAWSDRELSVWHEDEGDLVELDRFPADLLGHGRIGAAAVSGDGEWLAVTWPQADALTFARDGEVEYRLEGAHLRGADRCVLSADRVIAWATPRGLLGAWAPEMRRGGYVSTGVRVTDLDVWDEGDVLAVARTLILRLRFGLSTRGPLR